MLAFFSFFSFYASMIGSNDKQLPVGWSSEKKSKQLCMSVDVKLRSRSSTQ